MQDGRGAEVSDSGEGFYCTGVCGAHSFAQVALSTKYPFVWLFMALFSNLVKGGLPLEHLLSAGQMYLNSTKKGKNICLLACSC